MTDKTKNKSRFLSGQVCITRLALQLLDELNINPSDYFARHFAGDWGDLGNEDKKLNDQAILNGERILSRYNLTQIESIYIITEWDRSLTTLLLVEEY